VQFLRSSSRSIVGYLQSQKRLTYAEHSESCEGQELHCHVTYGVQPMVGDH
jgi:hypothetical protein